MFPSIPIKQQLGLEDKPPARVFPNVTVLDEQGQDKTLPADQMWSTLAGVPQDHNVVVRFSDGSTGKMTAANLRTELTPVVMTPKPKSSRQQVADMSEGKPDPNFNAKTQLQSIANMGTTMATGGLLGGGGGIVSGLVKGAIAGGAGGLAGEGVRAGTTGTQFDFGPAIKQAAVSGVLGGAAGAAGKALGGTAQPATAAPGAPSTSGSGSLTNDILGVASNVPGISKWARVLKMLHGGLGSNVEESAVEPVPGRVRVKMSPKPAAPDFKIATQNASSSPLFRAAVPNPAARQPGASSTSTAARTPGSYEPDQLAARYAAKNAESDAVIARNQAAAKLQKPLNRVSSTYDTSSQEPQMDILMKMLQNLKDEKYDPAPTSPTGLNGEVAVGPSNDLSQAVPQLLPHPNTRPPLMREERIPPEIIQWANSHLHLLDK